MMFFPISDFILEEMEFRGWNAQTLSEHSGIELAMVYDLLADKQKMTMWIAAGLATAFGTSILYWVKLSRAIETA